MKHPRPAPATLAQDPAAAATLVWPPEPDDLTAITCVDLTATSGEIRLPATPTASQHSSVLPTPVSAPLAPDLDGLRWPPTDADLETITAWSTRDGARRVTPTASRTRIHRSSPRKHLWRGAMAASAVATLLAAPLWWRQPPSSPLPTSAAPWTPAAPSPLPEVTARASAATSPAAMARDLPAARPASQPGTSPVRAVPSPTSGSLNAEARNPAVVAPAAPREAGEPAAADVAPAGEPSLPLSVAPVATSLSGGVGAGLAGTSAPPLDVGPPAAAPAPTAPPAGEGLARLATVPARVNLEEPRIQSVLARYGDAYSRLDADAARAVWPTVDARALSRAFESLRSQALVLEHCEVAVMGDRAEAACRGTSTYVPRVGDPTPRREPRQWRFQLARTDEATWQIESARSRAQ